MEIKKLELHPNFFQLGDSMCHERDFVCLRADVIADDGKLYHFEVRVAGDVRVLYNDCIYKNSMSMPDELLQWFKDGSAYNREDVEIIDNNWWESFIYDEDWKYVNSYCELDDIKADFKTEDEVKEYIFECIGSAVGFQL